MACVISERFDDLGSNGAPAKLGILGGTFDPIHLGHLAAAEAARVQCGLDAVLFIPAGTPVFKLDQPVTPASVRLRMCERAVLDNRAFDVSSIEVDRAGNTYTVDTLEQLRAHYPANVELFFITGADAALTIGKWRQSARIAELARLVVVSRPGSPVDAAGRAAIASAGFDDAVYVENVSVDVSSSDVRARRAQGESIRYYVPDAAFSVIEEAGLYRASADDTAAQVEDVFCQSFYDARIADLEQRVRPKRLKHILGVAQTARELAQAYDVNEEYAYLGGLLHDWDKGYDDDGIRARVRDLDLAVDAFTYYAMPQLLHGPTAAAALARAYPAIPTEVIQAIDRHTAGAVDMTDLDMVVYVADAIEPGRDFPGVDALRALVGGAPLEKLFFETFKATFTNLVEVGRTVHPDTVKVWNHYSPRFYERTGKRGGKRKG